MEIPVFLAFTAAELSSRPLGAHWGYLGCRFSASGLGLGNIPRSLPEGGMLIVTDSTDAAGHDPALVTGTLLALTETFRCDSVLLDLQKPGNVIHCQGGGGRAFLPGGGIGALCRNASLPGAGFPHPTGYFTTGTFTAMVRQGNLAGIESGGQTNPCGRKRKPLFSPAPSHSDGNCLV